MTAKEDFFYKIKNTQLPVNIKNRTGKLKCINDPNLRHIGEKRSFILWGLNSFLTTTKSLWHKNQRFLKKYDIDNLKEVFQIRGHYNIMDGSEFDSAIRNTELRIRIRIRILLLAF